MYLVASAYGQRPSAILGITDARLAYDFDLSVAVIALRQDPKAKIDPSQYADINAAFAAKKGR